MSAARPTVYVAEYQDGFGHTFRFGVYTTLPEAHHGAAALAAQKWPEAKLENWRQPAVSYIWEADLVGASLGGAHYSADDLRGALHVPER